MASAPYLREGGMLVSIPGSGTQETALPARCVRFVGVLGHLVKQPWRCRASRAALGSSSSSQSTGNSELHPRIRYSAFLSKAAAALTGAMRRLGVCLIQRGFKAFAEAESLVFETCALVEAAVPLTSPLRCLRVRLIQELDHSV